MNRSIKKATTYTKTMFDIASNKANNLGLTFHEYIKYLIAKDVSEHVEHIDNNVAKDIQKSKSQAASGKYKTITPTKEEEVNKMLDI